MKEQVEKILKEEFVSTDELRPALQRVYNDGAHVVATNGHILCEIDLEAHPELSDIVHGVPDHEKFPNWTSVIPLTPDRLAKVEIDLISFDVSEMKEKCSNCNGSGACYHDCNCHYCEEDQEECEDCWGKGYLYTLTNINDSCASSVYLNSVANLFRAMGFEEVGLWQAKPETSFVFVAPGVVSLVCPHRRNDPDTGVFTTVRELTIDLQLSEEAQS